MEGKVIAVLLLMLVVGAIVVGYFCLTAQTEYTLVSLEYSNAPVLGSPMRNVTCTLSASAKTAKLNVLQQQQLRISPCSWGITANDRFRVAMGQFCNASVTVAIQVLNESGVEVWSGQFAFQDGMDRKLEFYGDVNVLKPYSTLTVRVDFKITVELPLAYRDIVTQRDFVLEVQKELQVFVEPTFY
jgi:hypothetical protein